MFTSKSATFVFDFFNTLLLTTLRLSNICSVNF